MNFSSELQRHTNNSEGEVFRKSVAKLSSLQQKLNTRYHHDHFLRDLLPIVVDVPEIQS